MHKIRVWFFPIGLVIGLLIVPVAWGQEPPVRPRGQFLTDSIRVGKPFSYALSYRHDPAREVFFPDTTFSFAPFEIISQEYFITQTDERGSLDSTIYRLVSFEVVPAQTLALPVFVVSTPTDCTAVFAAPDTVHMRLLTAADRNAILTLRPETRVLPLRRQFNYSVFLSVVVSVVGLSLLLYWLFGRSINRQWKMFQLQRRHREFVRTFNRLNRNARERSSVSDAEKAVIVWKKYLERIEQKPFATYTTREILDNIPDEPLADALKDIDGTIYGQVKSKNMDVSLQVLRTVALRAYRLRRREIAREGKEVVAE
ncbi:hypothetical protein [Telluribacter sp.]|uniref:hypothetical protein n=1 Tax=Telluribacter sp. TaxID=1978767 RepID=UPI002E0DB903|nr:hypothetical protein [Telluribacter sp.]